MDNLPIVPSAYEYIIDTYCKILTEWPVIDVKGQILMTTLYASAKILAHENKTISAKMSNFVELYEARFHSDEENVQMLKSVQSMLDSPEKIAQNIPIDFDITKNQNTNVENMENGENMEDNENIE